MDQKKSMSVTSRMRSCSYAFNGIVQLFRQEPNAKLHAIATVVAIAAGIEEHITRSQWLAIIFAIGLVWITEAFNTCIEKLCNLVCDNKFHPAVKVIKDISAGAVLIAAIVSVVVAIKVFIL
jgi:diacylglycerol kinase (ATP)